MTPVKYHQAMPRRVCTTKFDRRILSESYGAGRIALIKFWHGQGASFGELAEILKISRQRVAALAHRNAEGTLLAPPDPEPAAVLESERSY